MQKKTVMFQIHIELLYDENSLEFQNALEGYKAVIANHGDADEMVQYVAASVHRQGWREMIEGVGYVEKNGQCTNRELYCGIIVVDEDPAPYVELYDTPDK